MPRTYYRSIFIKKLKQHTMESTVSKSNIQALILDTVGLAPEALDRVEEQMDFLGLEVIDDTTFAVLRNKAGLIIKIFPERIKILR